MENATKKKGNYFIAGALILILSIIFLLSFVESQQQVLYCAEKTTWGASCVMVSQEECATGNCQPTSCKSTTYCSTGTCVNTATGTCLLGTRTTCNPEQGGFFDERSKEDVPQCQIGCCIIGDGTALVERNRCDVLGKDYNIKATFIANIKDEFACASLASPKAKGACVFETERGRDCRHETREECSNDEGEFHEGFLCTAPELATLCAKTQRTSCVEGKHEVYFIDSCGNIANVYDANKINDVAYWSYVPGVEGVTISQGNGNGNVNSRTNGMCNYNLGSTCGPGNAQYGNYICRDLSCSASPLTGSVKRAHGESWCMAAGSRTSVDISYFENAKPGETSYLAYCYNGDVQTEVDYFRNKLCSQNKETGNAGWIINRWNDCILMNNEEDCLNVDERDCKLIYGGAGAIPTSEEGTRNTFETSDGKKASCAPKDSPGFKFWDPRGTIIYKTEEETKETSVASFCGFANIMCRAHYRSELQNVLNFKREYTIPSDQSCLDSTPRSSNIKFRVDVESSWAENWKTLSTSIGDCGVSANYLGYEGKNRWYDLFIPGNKDKVNLNTIKDLYSRK